VNHDIPFFEISLTLPGPAFYPRLQKNSLASGNPWIMIDKKTTRAAYTIYDYSKKFGSLHEKYPLVTVKKRVLFKEFTTVSSTTRTMQHLPVSRFSGH
jgi:hypothetical protein